MLHQKIQKQKMNLKSYPPIFLQQNTSEAKNDLITNEPTKEIKEIIDPIPQIDLQCLNLDNLSDACKNWGVFRLVNHGVPLTLLRQLEEKTRELLSLSFEEKQGLSSGPLSYFWGTPSLTPSGVALKSGPQNINRLEGFYFPFNKFSEPFEADHGDSLLLSFRALLEEYGKHLTRIATTIFDGLVKNLKIDPKMSKSYLSESSGLIRAYRYPKCSSPNEAWGLEAHTDSSVLSILSQDQVGGLEVLKDNDWFFVKPIPETLLVNLGDMMQAMSDDEYMSVKHRVKVNKDKDRFSLCYFVFPEKDCVIQTSKYKPFTYSDFQSQVQQDVVTCGFKIGLDRFKLPHVNH